MIKYVLLLTIVLSGCYSFKGVTISPELKTFLVSNFDNQVLDAPATIEVQIAERLRKKIRENSRLNETDVDPNVEFVGAITYYGIDFTATQAGNEAALNTLTLKVNVSYTDNLDDELSYTKQYSNTTTFSAQLNLQDVESDLVALLIDEITEQIFNETYTKW
jgi:hypothetical protein